MANIRTDTPIFQLLLTAWGIENKPFYYSLEHWQKLLKADLMPLVACGWLRISSIGRVALSNEACKWLMLYSSQQTSNYASLGIKKLC
jgi:hypothetical protein